MILATQSYAVPFRFGSINEDKEQQQTEAQKVLKDAGVTMDVTNADILRIGSSYAVDQDETIDGDVVIIGGALTVEGTINGDAAVIGGSMYLASTSVIAGDAVVIGGILQKEDGATVNGQIVENPEKAISLGMSVESGNVQMVEEGQAGEAALEGEAGERGEHAESEGEEDAGGEGDIVKIGEDIYIKETEVIHGDVVSITSDIRVDGEVQGDVVATSGNISLGRTAKVTGDVVSVFGDIQMEEGASVQGEVVKADAAGKHIIIGGKPLTEKRMVKAYARLGSEPQEGKSVRYRISLFAPEAGDVRLTGSFVNWDPEGLKMERDEEGTWQTYYDFVPGTYLYKFIVDGKAIPDPDVPDKKTEDGMGGYATVLVVKGKGEKMAVPIRFSLKRPDLDEVRVTGTFNKWDSEGIRMTKDEKGTWAVTVPIEPGRVLYKFYIDGEWVPDPDVAEQADDGQGGYATPFVVKAPEKKFTLQASVGGPERPGTNFSPSLDYNRVDGLYLAFVISNKTNVFPQPRFYLEGGHSKRRSRWLYTFEIEQPLLKPFMFSVGGSFYDKTDSYDKEIIGDGENFIAASLVKRDYRDYFDRRGVTGFVALRPAKCHTVKLAYSSDEYRALETRAHAAIFRRDAEFAQNPRNSYQIGCGPGMCWPASEVISLKSLGLSYEFDSRDCPKTASTGIWARLGSEWAGRDFGGDLDYTRYTADLRFYNKVSSKQKYAIRLMAGGMDVPADAHCPCTQGPEDFFPKQFYVGGIGTMPGYDYKEFKGTHVMLLNAEYLYLLKGNWGVVFFTDGGDARGRGESTKDVIDAMKFKFDAGVGFRYEDPGSHALTISLAKRLDDSDEATVISLRASRPF
jgi:hypothetical protein